MYIYRRGESDWLMVKEICVGDGAESGATQPVIQFLQLPVGIISSISCELCVTLRVCLAGERKWVMGWTGTRERNGKERDFNFF